MIEYVPTCIFRLKIIANLFFLHEIKRFVNAFFDRLQISVWQTVVLPQTYLDGYDKQFLIMSYKDIC